MLMELLLKAVLPTISKNVASKLARLTILVIYLDDLPKVGEPFDQLSGVILVEFDVGKVHLQNSRGRISHPEKH